jgi:hypothetical protein
MHNKSHDNVSTNQSLEMANSDQEVIVVNKDGLINDISNLLAFGILTGILIGGSIMHLILRFS